MALGLGSIVGGALGLLGGRGGADNITQKQETVPWGPQQQYYKDIFSQAQQQFQDPASRVAGFTDPQMAGQQAALQYAGGGMADFLGQARGGLGTFLDPSMLDPAANPYASAAVNAAINPIFQRLQEQILPGITSGAVQAGGIGSSRQGIAEGRAIEGSVSQALDTTSQMYGNMYNQALNRMLQASTYAPALASAGLLPAQTMMDVGGMQQAQEQRVLSEPERRLQQYSNIIGAPKGQTTTGTTQAPQANPLMSMLGGALMGRQLFPGGGGGGTAGGTLFTPGQVTTQPSVFNQPSNPFGTISMNF